MALSIKNPDVDQLARELAEITGESLTDAIANALKERLEREAGKRNRNRFREDIHRIQQRISRLDHRNKLSDEDIIGYDEAGIPN
jgi:antitoxin VapB